MNYYDGLVVRNTNTNTTSPHTTAILDLNPPPLNQKTYTQNTSTHSIHLTNMNAHTPSPDTKAYISETTMTLTGTEKGMVRDPSTVIGCTDAKVQKSTRAIDAGNTRCPDCAKHFNHVPATFSQGVVSPVRKKNPSFPQVLFQLLHVLQGLLCSLFYSEP